MWLLLVQHQNIFQSTLPRGERQAKDHIKRSSNIFQSTLPRGERRSCCNKVTVILDFNPRSHEGSDGLP